MSALSAAVELLKLYSAFAVANCAFNALFVFLKPAVGQRVSNAAMVSFPAWAVMEVLAVYYVPFYYASPGKIAMTSGR